MNNDSNHPPNDHDNGLNEGRVFAETFVFSGNGGQSFLATMHNLMNRLVGAAQPQQQDEHRQDEDQNDVPPLVPADSAHSPASSSSDGDVDMSSSDDPPVPELPPSRRTTVEDVNDDDLPALEPLLPSETEAPRPIRPLPRSGPRPAPPAQPHAHFHAHTPNGVIDLFTFSVAPGAAPPPPPPGGAAATFTFNLGPLPAADVLNGFEAFFLGMPSHEKEREPDPDRARVLLKGMEVVPEGLVRRLERAGGVPGGHGTEESGSAAGCAVCWGPLLDDIEPGEWETALHGKEKEKEKEKEEEGKKEEKKEEDELRGRIVALPCAHVYHAECLLPWFSRQTTCPTCRFDVDPESLTWTPRPPRSAPPPVPQPPTDAPVPPETGNNTNERLEQQRRANAAEALRFTAFMNSVFAGANLPPPPPFPGHAPQGQDHGTAAPAPQEGVTENSNPPVFGPPPPPPPPPPVHTHPPPTFLPLPSAWTQPGSLYPVDQVPVHQRPPPLDFPLPTADAPQRPPGAPQMLPIGPRFLPMPMIVLPPQQPIPPRQPAQHRRERRKWTPPEPVGKTLRQRVEAKERELGLRCDDVVCGVAPTDDEPVPCVVSEKRVRICAAYDVHGKACEHAFHPACLVTSARVAGADVTEDEVQVACPTCRAEGSLSRAEWEEGVHASEAEIA